MSTKARTSIDNGIWLCQSCSVMIDRDVLEFPAHLLKEWKLAAEQRARAQYGKRLPAERDAQDQVAMALTGLPVSFAPKAIDNVHRATIQVLEQLDPRFSIETSYQKRRTVIELRAREKVPFTFDVSPTAKPDWARQLAAFVKHGDEVRIPAEGVRLKGSPLFDRALSPEALAGGYFVLTPNGKRAVMKLRVLNKDRTSSVVMDDVTGELAAGTETFSFRGRSCSEIFSLTAKAHTTDPEALADLSFGINFDHWVGLDVAKLPYFDKLHAFYSQIAGGCVLELALEYQGMQLYTAQESVSDAPGIKAISVILEYTQRARQLARGLSKAITFQLSPPFDAEGHTRLAEVVSIMHGLPFGGGTLTSGRFTIIADEGANNILALEAYDRPHRISFVQEPAEPLVVFGQQIELPPLKTVLDNVVVKREESLASIQDGDGVPVTWLPAPGFTATQTYELEPDS